MALIPLALMVSAAVGLLKLGALAVKVAVLWMLVIVMAAVVLLLSSYVLVLRRRRQESSKE